MGKKSKKRKRLEEYRHDTLCAMMESVDSRFHGLARLASQQKEEMDHLMAEVGKCFEAVQVIRRDIQAIAQRTTLSNHREADILDELRLVTPTMNKSVGEIKTAITRLRTTVAITRPRTPVAPKKTKAKKGTPKNGTKKR